MIAPEHMNRFEAAYCELLEASRETHRTLLRLHNILSDHKHNRYLTPEIKRRLARLDNLSVSEKLRLAEDVKDGLRTSWLATVRPTEMGPGEGLFIS